VRRAYKFRLYPNAAQLTALNETLETCRRLYNTCLEQRVRAYEDEGRTLGRYEQSRWFTQAKKENPYYQRVNRSAITAVLIRLERAYQAFFRRVAAGTEKPGFPRFKGRDFYDSIEYQFGFKLIGDRLQVQHVGDLRVNLHRPIEGAIKTMVLKREAGAWFVVFSCVLAGDPPAAAEGPAIEVSLGNGVFLSASDGRIEPLPRYLEASLATIRRESRKLSRCVKGSKNREKVKAALAKAHRKIANQRKDHARKLAAEMTRGVGAIAVRGAEVEPLIVHDRPRSRADRLFNRAVHDAAWGGFVQALAATGERRGVTVTKEDDDA
jgi:putative transposase